MIAGTPVKNTMQNELSPKNRLTTAIVSFFFRVPGVWGAFADEEDAVVLMFGCTPVGGTGIDAAGNGFGVDSVGAGRDAAEAACGGRLTACSAGMSNAALHALHVVDLPANFSSTE